MKKAFIPLGISGGFVVLGLVASLALSIVTYVPETIKVESAGGTDVTAENPDEFYTQLKKTVIYSGAYYDGLKDLDKDPEPTPNANNSIAITCTGKGNYEAKHLQFERSLVVTQNHLGAFYQYDGWQIDKDIKTEQNVLIGISRYGMYVKFNKFEQSAQNEAKIDPMNELLAKAVQKRRGNWYKVDVSKEPSSEMSEDAMIENMAIQIATQIANNYHSSFLSSIDSNKILVDELLGVIEKAKAGEYNISQESEVKYRIDVVGEMVADFNFKNKEKPRVKLQMKTSGAEIVEEENLLFEHIDNTKVRIVERGKGDFYNLFGEGLIDAAKEAFDNMQE